MVRAREVSAPSLHSKTERPEQSEQYLPTPVMYYYYFYIKIIYYYFQNAEYVFDLNTKFVIYCYFCRRADREFVDTADRATLSMDARPMVQQ